MLINTILIYTITVLSSLWISITWKHFRLGYVHVWSIKSQLLHAKKQLNTYDDVKVNNTHDKTRLSTSGICALKVMY